MITTTDLTMTQKQADQLIAGLTEQIEKMTEDPTHLAKVSCVLEQTPDHGMHDGPWRLVLRISRP